MLSFRQKSKIFDKALLIKGRHGQRRKTAQYRKKQQAEHKNPALPVDCITTPAFCGAVSLVDPYSLMVIDLITGWALAGMVPLLSTGLAAMQTASTTSIPSIT